LDLMIDADRFIEFYDEMVERGWSSKPIRLG
jgi:hypothetical protein